MPTPSLVLGPTRRTGAGERKSAIMSPLAGTTLESTAVFHSQLKRAFFRLAASSSAVRSLRDGPILSRVDRANFVNELLLSMSRKSAVVVLMKGYARQTSVAGESKIFR